MRELLHCALSGVEKSLGYFFKLASFSENNRPIICSLKQHIDLVVALQTTPTTRQTDRQTEWVHVTRAAVLSTDGRNGKIFKIQLLQQIRVTVPLTTVVTNNRPSFDFPEVCKCVCC